MKSTLSALFAASTLALLSACGGSDDSPTSGTKTVSITSANQSDVARATVNGGFSLALVQNATSDAPTGAAAAERALQHVLHAAMNQRRSAASASAHPDAGGSSTDPCGVSGTVTSTWNDADNNNQLSGGDVLTASFQQCQETSTLSINGSLAITLTGTPTDVLFSANAAFQNVVAVFGGVTYTMSGTVALSETDTTTISSLSFTVGSPGFTVAVASTGYSDSIAFDPGMVVASSYLAGGSTLTLAGSFVAQSIGGRVTLATPAALTQATGDLYPSSGQVRITGANGSTLLATALNAAQVQLELDANGDGTVDSTTVVAWATLIP